MMHEAEFISDTPIVTAGWEFDPVVVVPLVLSLLL